MKYLLSLIFSLSLCTAVFAQESQETQVQSADSVETHVYNDIVSRSQVVDADGSSSTVWNLNFLSFSTEDKESRKSNNPSVRLGAMDLHFAFSELSGNDVDLKAASSMRGGFNILSINQWNHNKTFGVETDLGVSWTVYSWKNKNALFIDPQGQTVFAPYPDKDNYSRSRLTYVSWRLPVFLHFVDHKFQNHFSVGIEGELRHHLRSRMKVGKKYNYFIERHHDAINPWGCNLILSYGFKEYTIFGSYSLTNFFDSKRTDLSATPFSIGILLKDCFE